MISSIIPAQITHHKGIIFLRENARIIAQFIFTAFFIGMGFWFIRHEETELRQVRHTLLTCRWEWLAAGILLTVIYIFLQGMMYVSSFKSVTNSQVPLGDAVLLFLKRNFVSVFLPAGGISSLAFFTAPIESRGVSKSQIHFASSVYAFVGIISVVLVAVPAFLLAIFKTSVGIGEWVALAGISGLVLLLYLLYRSIVAQSFLYQQLVRFFPSAEAYFEDLNIRKIDRRHFGWTVFYSTLIEMTGIAHIYVGMLALRLEPSLLAASMAYITAVIFLIVSPFLRGMGAIEVSMSYVLLRFGLSDAAAISVTFFYRFLEFWLPLVAGAFSFLLKINRLIMRIFPALLLLVLGIVNIISVATPAISHRLHFLKGFLPLDAIAVSNYFILLTGLFMLVTAAFMLKGLRTAWYFALVLCCASIVGNLTKAIDYEEAIFALAVLVILIVSRKEYYVKNNPRLGIIGVQTMLLSCLAVLLYGFLGFYFLDKKHFNIDFSWAKSAQYTFQNFLLIGSSELVPRDQFAQDFLYSLNISGFLCLAFLVYTFVRPYIIRATTGAADLDWAKNQLEKFGDSPLDYFKTYPDKVIFRADALDCFVAYRVAGNFAIALEGPVGPAEKLSECIRLFDRHCFESGLKSIYYRVPDEKLASFGNKRKLFLGQEGVMDLTSFSLGGGSKKSIRNALKKVTDSGFQAKIYNAPLSDGFLERLQKVSDDWLADTGRSEIIFSQGMFIIDELRNQTIITVETTEEKIVAFLNIIPDFKPGEATYDLIRKTADAPNGVIDFIMVEMFNYLKSQGYDAVNLGFAPLSGIEGPKNFPERSMKFAYEKIRSLSHYKGLRDYKEKFSPVWSNKYLVYDQDYDLFQVPAALSRVIKP